MNMKATAAIMAMIMVASCIGLSVAEESDAEDKVVQAGVVATKQDTPVAVTLLVNDNAYISGDYTITWQVADNSANKHTVATSLETLFTADKPKVTGDKDGITGQSPDAGVSISAGDSELTGVAMTIKKETSGPYTFSMTPTDDGVYYIALKSVISVTVNSVSLDLDTVYYTITLDATNESMNAQQLSSPDAMDFIYGTQAEEALVFNNEGDGYKPADVKSLTWYAEGLPRGLAMSADGTVSGMPLEVGVFDDVKIHARNTSGQEYYGTLSITVTAASGSGSESFTYSVSGAATQAGGAYIIQQNDTLTLTVNTNGTATDGLKVTQVKISDDSGNLDRVAVSMSEDPANTHKGTITPEGTGAYTVSIKFGDAEAQFTLYVFAQPDSDVQAEIIVSAGESP